MSELTDALALVDGNVISVTQAVSAIDNETSFQLGSAGTLVYTLSNLPAVPKYLLDISKMVKDIHDSKLGGWRWLKKIGDVTELVQLGTGDRFKITSTPDIAKKEKLM